MSTKSTKAKASSRPSKAGARDISAAPADKLGKASKKIKPKLKTQEAKAEEISSSKERNKKIKIRKAELIFSVSPDFRKKYKMVAKEAGYKKSQFLCILIAHWLEKSINSP